MPSSNRLKFLGSGGKPIGCLFPVIAFLGLMAIGFVSTLLWKPEQLAKVNHCATYNSAELTYSNTCEFTINMQYCLYSKQGVDQDFCRQFELVPGASTPSLNADLAQLGGLLNNQKIACKSPYLPGQRQNWNTKRWQPACLEADDPDVGPHVSRKPRAQPDENF